mgnify:CR=1 FL=1
MSVFGDIISTNKPVLIVFYAGWHYLTEDASTSIQQVADSLGEAVRVIKIDIDRNKELTKKLQINGIPTYMIFYKGELVWRTEALQPTANLISAIKPFIES